MERYNDIKPYFAFELTPVPTSLFQDCLMWESNKSMLISQLFGKDFQLNKNDIPGGVNVVDGGMLLHRTSWREGQLFKNILEGYKAYVKSIFGVCTIVFDGYCNEPSPKDHEHQRRSSISCPKVKPQHNSIITVSQQIFLSSNSNKESLIDMLIPTLIPDNHTIKQAAADADTLIVASVLGFASEGQAVSLFANDTDILVMLVYHWKRDMATVCVKSDIMKSGKRIQKVFNVEEACSIVTTTTKQHILLIHAFTGCDTTSAIHDKGKSVLKKLLENSNEAQTSAMVFLDPDATKDDIGEAGIRLFVLLYGGKPGDKLADLRYSKYMWMAATSSRISPSKLPPTECAAYFHSL